MKKGYVQVYAEDGNEYATCHIGLSLRAIGAGYKIAVLKCLELENADEIILTKRFPDHISIEVVGPFNRKGITPDSSEKERAQTGQNRIREVVSSGAYDIVVLENINAAVRFGMITVEDILDIIELKPEQTELILTGYGADQRIIDRADLVTGVLREKPRISMNEVWERPGIL